MTADDNRDFLLAVVNAHDRSPRKGLRNRFVRLYRDWFPSDIKGENAEEARRILLFAYSLPHMWFFKDAPTVENLTNEFSLDVARLRDQLKSIWIAREDAETAKYRLEELKRRTTGRGGNLRDQAVWRRRTLDALEWLGKNLSRLLTCANPGCNQESHFFFRQHSNDRFCSKGCSESFQQQKRSERKAATPRRFKRSDESRLRMSESAKRRWSAETKKRRSGTAKSAKKFVEGY